MHSDLKKILSDCNITLKRSCMCAHMLGVCMSGCISRKPKVLWMRFSDFPKLIFKVVQDFQEVPGENPKILRIKFCG